LDNDAKKDKERRDERVKKDKKLATKKSDMRVCYKCPKDKAHPKDKMGLKKNGERSNLCQHHFDERNKVGSRRIRVHDKEKSAAYERTAKRKKTKAEYNARNKHKAAIASVKHRAKKLRENPVKHRKKNANWQKNWRKNNPQKIMENTKKRKSDPKSLLVQYKYQSETRGYNFLLTNEEFEKFLNDSCYYCGYDEKELNGIDRLDNDGDYEYINCVTACDICNIMKNTLNEETFILMCAHIAAYNKLIDCGEFPHVFNNHKSGNYSSYKETALKRGITFDLDEEEFKLIRDMCDCYTCGKSNSNEHTNGIDRKDNCKGYTVDNCELCCGDCNFLKKKLNHDNFLLQCELITLCHEERLDSLCENWTSSHFMARNTKKMNNIQREERRIKFKEAQHRKTMASKTPEAMKKREKEEYEKQAKRDLIERNKRKTMYTEDSNDDIIYENRCVEFNDDTDEDQVGPDSEFDDSSVSDDKNIKRKR
jgi:hypothetical protein